jgi:CHAD domain-containing protein
VKTSALVKSFLQKKTDHLVLSFEKPAESYSENDFHRLRVDIKRIRAMLTLLDNTLPHFHRKKYYAPFKIIFRQAGKIRDLQVQLISINANPLNTSIEKFERELKNRISKEKTKFFKWLTPSLVQDVCRKTSTIMDSLNQLDDQAVTRFLKKRKNSIQQIVSAAQMKPSGIHEWRKRIKEFYYLQKMLETKNSQSINTEQIQDLMGKWHDGRVLLKGLKTFMKSGSIVQKDRLAFESLKRKITGHNQELYQIILHHKADLLKLFT